MTCRWKLVLAAVVGCAVGATASMVITRKVIKEAPSSRAEIFLQRFCGLTRDAIRSDRLAFESGDRKRQDQAYERFYEGGRLYHGSQSVLLCAETIPSLPLQCRLQKDFACLAGVARSIEQELDKRPPH